MGCRWDRLNEPDFVSALLFRMTRLGDYEKFYAPTLALKRLRFRHTKVDSIPTDPKGDEKDRDLRCTLFYFGRCKEQCVSLSKLHTTKCYARNELCF